jgi:hypothetical protein
MAEHTPAREGPSFGTGLTAGVIGLADYQPVIMLIALSMVATPLFVALVAKPTVPRETSDVSLGGGGAEAGLELGRLALIEAGLPDKDMEQCCTTSGMTNMRC